MVGFLAAVSADAGAGAGTGAAGAELLAALLLSSSSRNAACSRACRNLCSSSSFSRSCITGDIRLNEAGGGGSMSGLYLNPYRGYDGSPGNNPGGLLMIPHRSRYICSSNPLV